MRELAEVANVLGVARPERPLADPFQLIQKIEDGLPLRALERVMELVAPGDATFKYRVIPKASLSLPAPCHARRPAADRCGDRRRGRRTGR